MKSINYEVLLYVTLSVPLLHLRYKFKYLKFVVATCSASRLICTLSKSIIIRVNGSASIAVSSNSEQNEV